MKILTLFLLLLSCPVFAQQQEEPVYIYLDSVKYEAKKVFFDTNNVQDVRMEKTAEDAIHSTYRYKSIHVKRKHKGTMASIEEMANSLRKDKKIPEDEKVKIVIDGVILTDLKECFIEQEYIKEIHIVVADPKTRGSHKYHEPTIIMKTKKNPE